MRGTAESGDNSSFSLHIVTGSIVSYRHTDYRHFRRRYISFTWKETLKIVVFSGSTPSRSAGFLGTSSPGPMADLYGTASQESAVSSYLSAASPAPSTGFSHSLGVR